MTVNVSMGSGGVGATVSMLLARCSVSGDSDDEEDKDEEEESVQDDDEEDVTEKNHTRIPQHVVCAPSPSRRQPVHMHTPSQKGDYSCQGYYSRRLCRVWNECV